MSEQYLLLYVGIVGPSGALLIWWIRRKLSKAEDQRSLRIKKLKRFEAAKTATPIDNPIKIARETAIESIALRFTIIKKISLFAIISVWFTALIFPFLNAIPATLFSILVGAFGIILGVAARPFIENLISGIVISFSQPIRIGDTVIIDNNYGTIEDITITHTVIKIWNWRRYIIPNSRMLAKEIINCTISDAYQWTHVEFYIAYDSDIQLVKTLAIAVAAKSAHFADYEEPRFWIMDMEERGYKCWIAAWADSPVDAWELSNDIRTELIKCFQTNGIKTHRVEIFVPEDTKMP